MGRVQEACQQPGGNKWWRKTGQGALHSGGKERFAAQDCAARKKNHIGKTGQRQDHQPHHEKFRWRKRMMSVMLGIVGHGKSTQAEETANQRGRRRKASDKMVARSIRGTDDAELSARGIGFGHCSLCTTKLLTLQRSFIASRRTLHNGIFRNPVNLVNPVQNHKLSRAR